MTPNRKQRRQQQIRLEIAYKKLLKEAKLIKLQIAKFPESKEDCEEVVKLKERLSNLQTKIATAIEQHERLNHLGVKNKVEAEATINLLKHGDPAAAYRN